MNLSDSCKDLDGTRYASNLPYIYQEEPIPMGEFFYCLLGCCHEHWSVCRKLQRISRML